MGNCVHKVDAECPLPNGQKLVIGSFTMSSSYAASGDTLNISNYLKDSGSPTIVIQSQDYGLKHDQGNAEAGKVLAYFNYINGKNGIDQNAPMFEVTAATNLSSTNARFIAIGQAY